jgi:Transcriptional regulator, AbiEi antitoxin/Protein of unknown function (DUF559)
MLPCMAGVPDEASSIRTEHQEPPRDRLIARLADRQHGVVALAQLLALGLTASAVRNRVQAGRLHPVHRGVYAVGRARLTREGHWMAAALAYGPSAVLSHRSAAALWGLRPDNRPVSEITVPVPSIRSRRGILAHTSITLRDADVTSRDGIPCTTPARTLLDLAEVVERRPLERAIEQAEILRLFDLRALEEVLGRAPGRRGAGLLRDLLAEQRDEHVASPETHFEELYLALCRRASLSRPEAGAEFTFPDGTPARADFCWRRERVVVELDSWAFHRTRAAFERDRRRDQQFGLLGYEVKRFTWRQVEREPGHVVAVTRAALAARALARAA